MSMKAMIVCVSVSHGNTKKVAEAIGAVLDAPVVEPEHVDLTDLGECDLVGFGSGIIYQALHPRLRRFVRSLPDAERPNAFVFTTSGFRPMTRPFTRLLARKRFDVIDTFSCRAHDTSFPFSLAGGINKGRPDASDLDAARVFAERLRDQSYRRSGRPRTQHPGRRPDATHGTGGTPTVKTRPTSSRWKDQQ